jgi:tRNA A-37 threonylcarbamoyl transferase component Bud32
MQHPDIRTPNIVSYLRGPYPIPYPISYRHEGGIYVAGPFLTEEKRRNIMIMERVNGRDLATEYGSSDGDTPYDVYDRCRNMIITLHNEGIIYPDITSYNFMLDYENEVWIIDFGHVREVSWFIRDFIDGHNEWNPDMA